MDDSLLGANVKPADSRGDAAGYPSEQRTPDGEQRVQGAQLRSGNQGLDDPGWLLGRRVAFVHGFICRIAGWRGEADSWVCAGGAQEAAGRQLEMLPRDGR